MKIDIPQGKYILAVSGGVDSMVLMDILAKSPVQLVVAHFNHGSRDESATDEQFVKKAAKKYGLKVEVGYGRLGKNVSEERAREARYAFLRDAKKKHVADAIITAHHQDDLIETAFINILRGTGRRGLTSIRSKQILRPLLHLSKNEIKSYARKNNVLWREDSTNNETTYLRNYIRLKVTPRLTSTQRDKLISKLDKVAKVNDSIDSKIATLSRNSTDLSRAMFTSLPTSVSNELLIHWFRENNLRDFDRKNLVRLANAIKTAKSGTVHEVVKGRTLNISKDKATLR